MYNFSPTSQDNNRACWGVSTIWRQLLNTITFENSNKVLCKLGPWTILLSMSCPNWMHRQALYIQHSDGLWYWHHQTTSQCRTRASPLTFETTGCTQQQLPVGATIVDVRKEGGKIHVAQDPTFALKNKTYEEASTQEPQQSPMGSTHAFANFQGFVDDWWEH